MDNPLYYTEKGTVDHEQVENIITELGYSYDALLAEGRHIIYKVSKDGKSYVFKMATKPELSAYIDNEYQWTLTAAPIASESWPIRFPQMVEHGTFGQLMWFIRDYVEGSDAKKIPALLDEVIEPMSIVMRNILTVVNNVDLPLDNLPEYQNPLGSKLAKIDYYEQNAHQNISELIEYLRLNSEILTFAPARGDIGARNIIKDTTGQFWLVDSEFASMHNVKFYDLTYFYYRLYVNYNRRDLAQALLRVYGKYSQLNMEDLQIVKWLQIYRIVAGYYEARQSPELIQHINHLRSEIML